MVVVNKIDRPAARPDWVVDSTFELFMDLGATDEQCEFPVVYASGVNGIAGGCVFWGGGGRGVRGTCLCLWVGSGAGS